MSVIRFDEKNFGVMAINENTNPFPEKPPAPKDTTKVIGIVHWGVDVECPYCHDIFDLNQPPYTTEISEFYDPDDQLGGAVFGGDARPARWNEPGVSVICKYCRRRLELSGLEV